MPYQELLTVLKSKADKTYAEFHKKLLGADIPVLGVRVPELKKIAKLYKDKIDLILSFPDEYYEVTFIKLSAVSLLEWEEFIKYVDECVRLIDNWATCDCFKGNCIKKNKQAFVPYVLKFAQKDKEFYQRYALKTLLQFYVDDIPLIKDVLNKVNLNYYYVHMAAAWLVAEVFVNDFDKGIEILNDCNLDKKTVNKAIQKANESFRLLPEQKKYLKELKK